LHAHPVLLSCQVISDSGVTHESLASVIIINSLCADSA